MNGNKGILPVLLYDIFLVSFVATGNPGNKVTKRVSIDVSNDNGANSQSHFGIHEQLRESYPLRFPKRQFSKSISKNHLLQTSARSKQATGTIDENYESCQYWWHPLGESFYHIHNWYFYFYCENKNICRKA